ncbi:integrase [Pelomonas sp. P7]|uniref:Integrase n=1 Tax=Pelomonas caseinilytica TaxID=2906763 RepID=A0ABS8XLM6_9BURK|nr:integrase [Pelomonas sp. P7]MCE4540683.1 integrase [Pelomonas sp. P7]
MSNIVQFIPRADLDALTNLNAFIAVCKDKLTVFGASLPFESNSWVVTEDINLKGKSSAVRLVFSSWSTVEDKEPQPMKEPFLSFAKSYIRYQHSLRPTKAVGPRLAALRALEAALAEFSPVPNAALVTHQVLDRAAQLIASKFTPAVAYRVGGQLQMVSDLLVDHRSVAVLSKWLNPISRPLENGARVGKEFDEKRQQKLPSPVALDALARAFHAAVEAQDVVVTSVAAILCSAPDRIHEVLLLPENCEVLSPNPTTNEQEYGLRWHPGKGADPMVKWVVRAMADVVRKAVSQLRQISAPAREIARWYESHPKRMFLPPSLEHLRQQERITLSDLAQALFAEGGSVRSARTWLIEKDIEYSGPRGQQTVAFDDVEKAVVAMLPAGFPVADSELDLKYSDMLCVVRRNTLHSERGVYHGAIEKVTQGQIYDKLAGSAAKMDWTIFARLGFYEDDGSVVRITSHQFRHYLNTLAQMGGLSQLDIAKWSGRRHISQNNGYDHESSRDVVEYVRKMSNSEHQSVGPLARLKGVTLIPRDEFARLKIPTAHTTEFGYCVHDFTMTPCQIHLDCMNCDEQVCIKGDRIREENLRRQREETRQLLVAAVEGRSEGYAGTDRWITHQTRTLKRMDQLCEILDDPRVPVGAVIQPSGVVPASRIEQAAQKRLAGQRDPRTKGARQRLTESMSTPRLGRQEGSA